MNNITVPPFNAFIMIGLEVGFTLKTIDKNEVIKEIQRFQIQLHKTRNVLLSANVIECQIVLKGQIEPHLKIEFINYPHSNIAQDILKTHIKEMAKYLMDAFKQNRVLISFNDEIIMYEINSNLDPRIK